MNEIRKAENAIRSTSGRFFYCEFVTKGGRIRRMTARLGVRKSLTGEGLAYNPSTRELVVVWDVKNNGYRMVNVKTLLFLKCGKLIYDDRTEAAKCLQS
jgi:hypothetical protein